MREIMKDFDKHKWVKELNDSQSELSAVSNEYTDAVTKLEPYYEELKLLKEKYDLNNIQKSIDRLKADMNSLNCRIRYYTFRAIVDSIYDELKEYGRHYYSNINNWLRRNFNINIYLACGTFEEFWIDNIHDENDDCYLPCDCNGMVSYESYDGDEVKFPQDINLQSFVSSLDVYMSQLKHEEEANKEVEEYNEYLRLKKKFGGD